MSRLQVKKGAVLIASCIAVLCITSCSPKPQSSEARKKTLNEMKGPEVDSIKGALLKQINFRLCIYNNIIIFFSLVRPIRCIISILFSNTVI